MNYFGFSTMLAIAMAATIATPIHAQSYPARPVRVVVPTAPGGASDIQARLFSQKLSQGLGQSFLVDNRGGAGGLVAFNYIVQQSPGDGYTLLACSPGFTILPSLYEKPPIDAVRDFEPIIVMGKAPYALVVHPSFPANNVGEFINWAKANPGKLNMAIAGLGTPIHLAALWVEAAGGVNTTMVPYKGNGPAMQDLIAGQVQAGFATFISSGAFMKAGKIRALAVTSSERSPYMPDLPTLAESGMKDFEVTTWQGWLGPRGTPQSVVSIINAELNKVLKSPDVVKMFAQDGSLSIGGSPDTFRRLIISEVAHWKQLVKAGSIKPPAD